MQTEKLWTPPSYKDSQKVEINYKRARANHCLITDEPGPELNSINVLRGHLLNLTRQRGLRTIMVTSVQPGEGKTVTAINLSFAVAREHQQTVVLVDCDLRRPSIGRYLGIQSNVGLLDYFLDEKPLHDIILWPGVEKLTLILANRSAADSAEISGSPKMKLLVSEMKDRYEDRYIFFDVPPLLSGADALAFLPHVDCVLIVVEAARTSARDIKKAQALIPPEKLLGFVLNKSNSPVDQYYYY